MHERSGWPAQAAEIELDLKRIPNDPFHLVGLLERILPSQTWIQLLLKMCWLLCLSETYGALVPSTPKSVLFVHYIHGCTCREHKCMEDGWLYLEQVVETSHELPKGTETPTSIHNRSITVIFRTHRHGCPSTALSSFGSYTSAPSFHPASQCCISIYQSAVFPSSFLHTSHCFILCT